MEVICFICQQVISFQGTFNVKRRYETNHKSYHRFMGFPAWPSCVGSINFKNTCSISPYGNIVVTYAKPNMLSVNHWIKQGAVILSHVN